VSSEALQAIRTVRAFATGDVTERARYSHHIDVAYRAGYWQSWVYGGWTGLVGTLFMFAVIGVLVVGGHLVERGELTAGSLLSFLLYTVNLAATVGGIAGLFAQLMQAVGSSQKVFEMLDLKPQVGLDEGTDILRILGKVEFRDVSFAYPTRPGAMVLDKVTFTAEPDQVLALVGASGSGKSTVISLLLRFYDPDHGMILVDGEDARNIAPRALYRHMALVSQEPVLFSQTILENIVYGRVGLPQEDIDVALEQASAKFVYDFPEGLATQVGERGIQLSGGQKQRLAIARALLVHPSLLLLDEATSALDAESEHEVQRALDKLVARKCQTVILIAHRLSTVRSADQIIVLDKGVVAEKGKHEDLMLKKGVYSRLIARQLSV
jgi:ATP-binding cassette subfamily B protein